MSAKPTPGPWAIHDIGLTCLYITANMPLENVPYDLREYYSSIATVTQRDAHPRYDVGISRATCAANARLMAAAPDLLAILKAIINDGMHCDVVPHLHEKAREAIKKAEGKA